MLLSPDDAELFFKLHRSLMHFVNQRLGIVPDIAGPDEFASLPLETGLEVRKALLDDIDLIESFVNENPANLGDDELDIVLSWRHQVSGTFYALRQLKKYMVFLACGDRPMAYGVVALSEPFEDVFGPYLPRMIETVLLPFKDRIVYDGLLRCYNVSFGGGTKRILNDSYRLAKERLGILASLPVDAVEKKAVETTKQAKRKPKKNASRTKDVNQVLQTIVAMTDDFCRRHLNDEYAKACRKLAETLSRKRPSPLRRGRPTTWACGIIRTIGMVNFLDDSTTQPHMKLTAIDKTLGVGESTGQAKAMEIRKMLKIRQFDTNWTLPSRTPAYRAADSTLSKLNRRSEDEESNTGKLFQFKITLNDSKPPIWRRIQVTDCMLDELHEYIQTAMGWTNSHLHQFEIDGRRYGDPELLDDDMNSECVDSTVTKISDIVPGDGKRFRFCYEYDFGDGWEHEVLFEGSPPAAPGRQYPLCVEGERACPPEDVGGLWGYEEFLEAVADPNHERHDELLDWSGPFDPIAFDAVEATQVMRRGLRAWR